MERQLNQHQELSIELRLLGPASSGTVDGATVGPASRAVDRATVGQALGTVDGATIEPASEAVDGATIGPASRAVDGATVGPALGARGREWTSLRHCCGDELGHGARWYFF